MLSHFQSKGPKAGFSQHNAASSCIVQSHGMKSWGSLCELQCGLYFWRLRCWSLLACIKLHHAFVKVWKSRGGSNNGIAIQPTWPLGPKLTVAHHLPTQHQLFRFVAQHTRKSQNIRSKAWEVQMPSNSKSSREVAASVFQWHSKTCRGDSEINSTISQLTPPRSRWNLEDTGLHWLPGDRNGALLQD